MALFDRSIVLLDDAACARDYHAALLRLVGYETVALPGTLASVEQVLLRPPDLLILDPDLNEFDGFELVSLLRKQRSYRPTSVLVVTPHEGRSYFASEARRVCEGFLSKPVSPVDLVDLAHHLLMTRDRAVGA